MARVCKRISTSYALFISNFEILIKRLVMRIWSTTYLSPFQNPSPASSRVSTPSLKRLEPSITSQLDSLLMRLWNPIMDLEGNPIVKSSPLMRVEEVESVTIIKGIIGRVREVREQGNAGQGSVITVGKLDTGRRSVERLKTIETMVSKAVQLQMFRQ